MKKKALVFPGQGSQKPYMGKSFYDKYLVAKEVFQEAEDSLSMNITSILFSSDEEALKQTDFCQVALFTTSLAILGVLEDQLPEMQVSVCGGLSLGECSAVVAARRVSFQKMLPIVQKRGQFMAKASQQPSQGMSAIIGLSEDKIPSSYQIANLNCPGQVVIAGSQEEMKKAQVELKEIGARRVIPLKVMGAFHTSYMTSARDQLAPYVYEMDLRDSSIDMVMNLTGKIAQSNEDIKEGLIEQVHKKTRWLDCMKTMSERDVEFIECGPRQLSSLNKKMDTVNSFVTIEEDKDLEGLYEKV